MEKISKNSMFIYISGPYSSPHNETSPNRKREIIEKNIENANKVAIAIANKGHFPFVPHTMMHGWEDINEVPRQRVMQICQEWVKKCDAMFIIAPSEGVKLEQQLAVEYELQIYHNLDDIPDVSSSEVVDLSLNNLKETIIKCYLAEYHECMESYRHTYATIWQSGAIFTAISAALVAFAGKGDLLDIPPFIQVLAPLPILFWILGIFLPMNRYGEIRANRLGKIENLLNLAVPGLQMSHFKDYNLARKGKTSEGTFKNIFLFRWWHPRVIEIIGILGFALVLLEIYLFWVHYLSSLIIK